MVFIKISLVVFLVLCTIHDSESRYHSDHKKCGCVENAELDIITGKSKKIQHDKLQGEEKRSSKDKKLDKTDLNNDHENTIPQQYYQPHLNVKPYITEQLLKQLWLSHYLRNNNPQEEKISKYIPETKHNNYQIPLEIYPRRDNIEVTSYVDRKKLDEQRNSEITALFSSKTLSEDQFDTRFDSSDFNSDDNQSIDSYNVTDDNDSDYSSQKDLNSDDKNTGLDYNQDDSNNNDQSAVTPLSALPENIYNVPYYEITIEENKQILDTPSSVVKPDVEHYLYGQNSMISQKNTPPPHRVPLTKHGIHKQQVKIAQPPVILQKIPEFSFDDQDDTLALHKIITENIVPGPQAKIPPPQVILQKYSAFTKLNKLRSSSRNYQPPSTSNHINFNNPYEHDSSKISDEQGYRVPAPHIAPKIHKPEHFAEWVLKKLKTQYTKNQRPDKVHFTGLGYSILQILRENGMYISDKGMLIDTYGTVSDIHSLHLTPINIGNTMSLMDLLEGKYGGKSSKTKMPYLHAVLVSASQPLKILGVVPIGTIYLPLQTLNSDTNIQIEIPKELQPKTSAKNDEVIDEIQIEEKQSGPEELQQNKSTGDIKIVDKITKEEKPEIPTTKPSHDAGEIYYEPDSPDYKTVTDNNSINEELEANAGRLFIPHIQFRDQPIDIVARRHDLPIAIASKIYEPARIHIPSVNGLIDIAFRSKKEEGNNVESNITPNMSNKFGVISDLIGKFDDSAKALLKLNFLKKDSTISTGEPIIQNRRLQVIHDMAEPILKLKKFGLKDKPLDDDMNIPSVDELDLGSRSGVEPILLEIPPESIHQGNSPFDVIENNNDDDDGDFRIIGGNAATGSGTPLSNKGRSGYML